MSSLKKIFQTSLEYSFYALFFFTPLILWYQTSEVFEFNKMLFIYVATIIITANWLGLWITNKKITLRRTPLDIPLGLFLLSQVLSTIFSIDPPTSLWGYYSRWHGSLISTISYILLYYAFINNFISSNKKVIQTKILNVIYALLASALLISLYAILEHFGIDKKYWVQDVQNRVFSTLGQPNWLSAYLLALFPLPFYLGLNNLSKKRLSLGHFLLTTAIFATILFTKSRSGIAATFIILTLIFFSLLTSKKTRSALLLATTCLLLVIFIGSPWSPNPKQISHRLNLGGPLWIEAEGQLQKLGLTSQIKPLEIERLEKQTQEIVLKRAAGERVGGSDSFDIRRIVWQGAWNLGKKYPFLGTGVETFGYSYYWVRPVKHNLLSEWDFLYNKAHNEYLNYLATTGFLGLFSYLLLIFWTLAWWLKSLTAKNYLSLALFLGYTSLLITNFFGFSVVNIGLFFFLFPAFVFLLNPQTKPNKLQFDFKLPQTVSLSLIALAAIYPLLSTFRLWRADIHYNQGKNLLQNGFLQTAHDQLELAHKLKPNQSLYTSQLALAQAQIAVSLEQQIQSLPASTSAQFRNQAENLRDDFISQAVNNSRLSLDQNPYHTLIHKNKARIELFLGLIDPQYTSQSLTTLMNLSRLAPTDAKILYNIGLIYETLGDSDRASQTYNQVLKLKPDYQEVQDRLNQLENQQPSNP